MVTEIETIGCNCGCNDAMPPPATPEQEREQLRRQRELIEQRLAQLDER